MFDLLKYELEALKNEFKKIVKKNRINPNVRISRSERRLMERMRK